MKKESPSIKEQIDFYNNYWSGLKPFSSYKLQRIEVILKHLRKLKKNRKDTKILDFGCGDGRSVAIWNLFGTASGFDLSEEAMKVAKEIFPLFEFDSGDACNASIDSESFNVIITQEVIEHIIDQQKFIEECSRLLTTDGIMILTTPNKFYFDRLKGGNYSKQPIENILLPKELKNLLKNHFEILEFYSIITAKGDFGIYKIVHFRYLIAILRRLRLLDSYNRLLGYANLNLHLIVVAKKK